MSAGICLGRLSPLSSQGRRQGEGPASQLESCQKTPHLNPLPFTKGEMRTKAKHTRNTK
jgi:hypothetical protein